MSGSDDKLADVWKWAKRQAIGQMDLSFGARECWRILDGFPPGKCYPSHWFIAEKLRKSQSAVRRYLRELKLSGYISINANFCGIVLRNTYQRPIVPAHVLFPLFNKQCGDPDV
ncbi:MAG: hypothetical protein ABL995_20815 [Bryobacteraceae bacterium]